MKNQFEVKCNSKTTGLDLEGDVVTEYNFQIRVKLDIPQDSNSETNKLFHQKVESDLFDEIKRRMLCG